MPQAIRRHGLCELRGPLPEQPAFGPSSFTAPSTAAAPATGADLHAAGRAARGAGGTHEVGLPEMAQLYRSADGTRRYLLRLEDGRTVETVLMPEGERDTICISSQVGCPVDCKFCMTALLGLERNLTAGEIVGQVLLVARDNGAASRRHGAPQYRDDGAGRAAAESGQRPEGDAHSAGPRGLRPLAAAHHGLHGGHHSEDCGTGGGAGAAQAGDLAERLHRGDRGRN